MRGEDWNIYKWFACITESGKDEEKDIEDCLKSALVTFRCKDDDGYAYCEGKALNDKAAEEAFDAMKGSYGCTSIELLENGEWKPFIG